MPERDDYYDDNYYYAEEWDSLSDCPEEDSDDAISDIDDDIEDDPLPRELPMVKPIVWRSVKIGDAFLCISSDGYVKKAGVFEPATEGLPHQGTPYRVYIVEVSPGNMQQYFVHDLVYAAFHGAPPPDHEVVHRTTGSRASYYKNTVSNLIAIPCRRVSKPTIGLI